MRPTPRHTLSWQEARGFLQGLAVTRPTETFGLPPRHRVFKTKVPLLRAIRGFFERPC